MDQPRLIRQANPVLFRRMHALDSGIESRRALTLQPGNRTAVFALFLTYKECLIGPGDNIFDAHSMIGETGNADADCYRL